MIFIKEQKTNFFLLKNKKINFIFFYKNESLEILFSNVFLIKLLNDDFFKNKFYVYKILVNLVQIFIKKKKLILTY